MDTDMDQARIVAQAVMREYELSKQHLADLMAGPDAEAMARLTAAQDAVALAEADLKQVVKTLGENIAGDSYEAILQERRKAPTIEWHIDKIKTQPWSAAVIIETVDVATFDLLVKSKRITEPEEFARVTPGDVIKAVSIKVRTI